MPDLDVWPTDGSGGAVSTELRWRKMARLWVPSGVTAAGGGLAPTIAAGPAINVAIGSAWVDGHFAELTAPASIPVTANGLLVLRLTPADNRCELLYRDGASAPTQTDPTWELALAKMTAGAMTDIRPGAVMSGAQVVGGLPAFPYDGQEVVYVYGGRAWHCTYYAAVGAPYRWMVSGGPPLANAINLNEVQTAGVGVGDLVTVGPDLIIPYPGVYDVQCGFNGNNSGAGSVQNAHIVNASALATPLVTAAQSNPGAAGASNLTVVSMHGTLTLPAATTLRLRYSTTGANGYYAARWLTARPIRLLG